MDGALDPHSSRMRQQTHVICGESNGYHRTRAHLPPEGWATGDLATCYGNDVKASTGMDRVSSPLRAPGEAGGCAGYSCHLSKIESSTSACGRSSSSVSSGSAPIPTGRWPCRRAAMHAGDPPAHQDPVVPSVRCLLAKKASGCGLNSGPAPAAPARSSKANPHAQRRRPSVSLERRRWHLGCV